MNKGKVLDFVIAAVIVGSNFMVGLLLGGIIVDEIAGCAKIKTPVVQKQHMIIINGPIDLGSGNHITRQIDSFPAGEPVTIVINSPGGYVFEANEIIDKILTDGRVETCKVTGMAASAAALITSACEKVEVAPNSYIMFHLPFIQGPDGQKIRTMEMIEYYLKLQDETIHIKKILGDKYYRYASGQDVELTSQEFLEGIKRRNI